MAQKSERRLSDLRDSLISAPLDFRGAEIREEINGSRGSVNLRSLGFSLRADQINRRLMDLRDPLISAPLNFRGAEIR